MGPSIVVMDKNSSDQWLIPFGDPAKLHLWDVITIGDKEYMVTSRKWTQTIGGPYKLIFYVERTEVSRD